MKRIMHKLGACNEAFEWAGALTLKQAWKKCQRPDWMLWLYQRHNPDRFVSAELAKQFAALGLDVVGASNWGDVLRSLPRVVDEATANQSEFFCWFARDAASYASASYASASYASAANASAAASFASASYASAASTANAANASSAASYASANASSSASYASARQTLKAEMADMIRAAIPVSHFEGLASK